MRMARTHAHLLCRAAGFSFRPFSANAPFSPVDNSARLGHALAPFPKPWTVEPIPSGFQVLDAYGIVLAHVYGQPDGALAISDIRLTSDEARRISKLISRLPELVELEQHRNKAK